MRLTGITIIAMLVMLATAGLQPAEARNDTPGSPGMKTVKLSVPGADCASTGAEADTILRGIEGVSEVDVDIEETTAVIKYDPSKTTIENIKRIMKAGDYPVTGVDEMD